MVDYNNYVYYSTLYNKYKLHLGGGSNHWTGLWTGRESGMGYGLSWFLLYRAVRALPEDGNAASLSQCLVALIWSGERLRRGGGDQGHS